MKRFQIRRCTIYTTDVTREDASWDLALLLDGFFARRRLWRTVVRTHSRRNRLPRNPVVLSAHGETRDGRWYFQDSHSRSQLLQDWIDEHDGESGSLLLFCCNYLNCMITAQRSLILHLNRSASRWDLFRGGCVRLFHPRFGYIEDNYYRMHQLLGS